MRAQFLLIATLALTLAGQSASAARSEGQFDLVCDGKILKDSSRWGESRWSIDLGRGLFCAGRECNEKPPKRIARVTPTSLVLIDREAKANMFRTLLIVSNLTDEATIEMYKPEGIKVVALAQCRREAFTQFPPSPTP
ncbi:MAG: hypothetical protein ABIT68_03770 [Sphingomicrobium sp.]